MLLQFVAEMKGEYFPPNLDIILKNQIPGDFYIIVSGTVNSSYHIHLNTFNIDIKLSTVYLHNIFTHANGSEQFLEKEGTPNLMGEIVVLLDIPQPFTVRTTKLSQLLRLGPLMIQSLESSLGVPIY
ncbi:hypothetical protein SUGI_0862050 [Cryptomeria japonica]|nr:hypothetical protein SUGI_0862050 [Cryptomeria japonica]